VIVEPLRGLLLARGDKLRVPHAYTVINAIPPSFVLAFIFAVLLAHYREAFHSSRLLIGAWCGFVILAAADLLTQSVGLDLYGIGFIQYLVYPTFAIFAFAILEPGDVVWVVRALVAMGAVVALSMYLEAWNLIHVVEAVPPYDPVTMSPRYGGSTGSYLHASMFLGTVIPLAFGLALSAKRWRSALAYGSLAALALGGLILTYSRGGVAISVAALLVVLAVHEKSRRFVRALTLLAVIVAAGIGLGRIGGIPPIHITHPTTTTAPKPGATTTAPKAGATTTAPKAGATTNWVKRVGSSVNWSSDKGNVVRLASMKKAIHEYAQSTTGQKIFGRGLAFTGNTQKILGLQPNATESYFLKLLVEGGAFGLLIGGGFILLFGYVFARLAFRFRKNPTTAALGASGFALTLYAFGYPTLEPQLIAMTWWLLVAAALVAMGSFSLRPELGYRKTARAWASEVRGKLRFGRAGRSGADAGTDIA
jgi:hypothetical protein